MATGKSGTWQFNSTSAQSYLTMGAIKFVWEEEYDIASNTSTVKITSMQLLAGGDGYGNQNYGLGNLWFNGSVKINGVVAATLSRGYNSVYVVPAYNEFKECVAVSPAYPWTVSNIAHDSDGSKSVDIVVDIFASTTNNNYKTNTNIKGSTSIALTTIPRSSSMSVSNGTLGTAQTISVTKSSDSFSHTITWACGTKSGTVCTKSTSTSISFTPSLDLATENTTGTSVSVTFTLQTYNGSTAIGSAVSKTVSMNIPSSVKPSCSISVSDPTGYYTTFGGYIQRKSKLAVTITPTLSYGSPISTYKTTANGSTYTSSSFTTGEISSSGSVSISSTVTDGRGRSGSATSTVTVIAYSAPSISYLSVNRCNADGTENQSGAYTKVTYSFDITSLSNKNSKTITLNYKKSSESSWTSVSLPSAYSATYATSIIPTDDGSSYDIQIVVQDYFEQTTRATSVSTAATIFHVHPSGNGFAFGKISEEEDCLDIGWSKVKIGGKYVRGTARNLLDNSDFRNPVNQRGLQEYTSNGYSIDRWMFEKQDNVRLVVQRVEDGFPEDRISLQVVSGYADFYQNLENYNKMAWKRYTLAVNIKGVVYAQVFTMGNFAGGISLGNDGAVFYSTPSQNVLIRATTAPGFNMLWMALYEGEYTAETLPEYQPKGYGAELAECMLYYRKSYDGNNIKSTTGVVSIKPANSNWLCTVNFDTPMRAVPTITLYSPVTGKVGCVSNFYTDVDTATVSVTATKRNFAIALLGGFDDGSTYYFNYEASADL